MTCQRLAALFGILPLLPSSPVQMELHFSQVVILYAQITLVFRSYSLWIKERYF